MAKGDHFFVWRHHHGVPFQHHVIDIGDLTVVHFTDGDGGVAGPGGSEDDFVIRRTSIDVATRGGRDTIYVVKHRQSLPADEVVDRAMSQVGRRGYHLLFDNCEHFACWCVVDRQESRQVSVACERLSATGVKAMAAATARIASGIGAKGVVRGASPLMLLADAAQWATEAGGHHVGLHDPIRRRRTGRAVGGATALGVGALGGPPGVFVAGGVWMVGELAGKATHAMYERIRRRQVTGAQP